MDEEPTDQTVIDRVRKLMLLRGRIRDSLEGEIADNEPLADLMLREASLQRDLFDLATLAGKRNFIVDTVLVQVNEHWPYVRTEVLPRLN